MSNIPLQKPSRFSAQCIEFPEGNPTLYPNPDEHPTKKDYYRIGFISKESNKNGNEFNIYYNFDTGHIISEPEGFLDRRID